MSAAIYGRHEGPAYITSGSTSGSWYRSDPYESRSGEAVEPPLKAKYLVGGTAPKFNKHSDNNAKAKNKIPYGDNPPSKVMVMADATRGRTVMMTRDQFASLPWGWIIE